MSSIFEEIKKKTGINPFVLIGSVVAAVLLILYGHCGKIISTLTGVLYPMYMSLKAIETKEEDDDKQWCTYWVVFFLFVLFELYFAYLLEFIPFYFLIKLIFLVWLFFPSTQGAVFVYDSFLSKIYSKYEKDLDKIVDTVGESVARGYNDAKTSIKDNKGKLISGAVNIAANSN